MSKFLSSWTLCFACFLPSWAIGAAAGMATSRHLAATAGLALFFAMVLQMGGDKPRPCIKPLSGA